MRPIDVHTKLCAIIGDPVAHSLSPMLHNAAFDAANLDYVYLAFHVTDLPGCIAGMRAMPSFRGISVTIPHKMNIIPLLDEVDPMAAHVGSVNTVTNENGVLIGSTTDGPGALRALTDAGVSLDGKRVLFVGSGGAVRAVAFAVAEMTQATDITLIGRTPSRVAAIVDDIRAKTDASIAAADLLKDLEAAMATYDVVIQGTPVGMHPNAEDTPIPKALLRPEQVVFDTVYRPHKTRLIREAEAVGCTTVLGIEMLVNQAVLQFERWTGIDAPKVCMRDAVARRLAQDEPGL